MVRAWLSQFSLPFLALAGCVLTILGLGIGNARPSIPTVFNRLRPVPLCGFSLESGIK